MKKTRRVPVYSFWINFRGIICFSCIEGMVVDRFLSLCRHDRGLWEEALVLFLRHRRLLLSFVLSRELSSDRVREALILSSSPSSAAGRLLRLFLPLLLFHFLPLLLLLVVFLLLLQEVVNYPPHGSFGDPSVVIRPFYVSPTRAAEDLSTETHPLVDFIHHLLIVLSIQRGIIEVQVG